MTTKRITCEQTWTLENFSFLLEPESVYMNPFESTRFDSTGSHVLTDQLQFSLQLVPCFEDKNDATKHISLYLQLFATEGFEKQQVDYQFAILGDRGEKIYVKESQAKFDQLARSLGFPKFISYDKLADEANGFLVNGNLLIYCQVSYEIIEQMPELSAQEKTERKLAELRLILELEKIKPEPVLENELTFNQKQSNGVKGKSFLGIFSKGKKYDLKSKKNGL